jgi:hypothetical protein
VSDPSTVINTARTHGTLNFGSKFSVWWCLTGEIMIDPATCKKYAEECRRLATTASENDRRLLLEHAAVWVKLAQEAEREAANNT